MLRQQYLQMRACKISQIEDERKPRMILLVHPQETMRFLGFPIARYSTSTIPKNHARHPDDRRGRADRSRAAHAGAISCWLRCAKAVREHKAKFTVFVSHYAMSGGTLIALAVARSMSFRCSSPIDDESSQARSAILESISAVRNMTRYARSRAKAASAAPPSCAISLWSTSASPPARGLRDLMLPRPHSSPSRNDPAVMRIFVSSSHSTTRKPAPNYAVKVERFAICGQDARHPQVSLLCPGVSPDSDRRRRPRGPLFQMQRHQKVSRNKKFSAVRSPAR
jgi:hypothetical protein